MIPERPSEAPLRYAQTDRGPFSYTDEGAGSALVFVHGLPGSTRDFRWLASALGDRVRSIRLDQPGFGETPASTGAGPALSDRAAFVRAALDALSLDEVVLVAHSMGGAVAMHVASQIPDRVRGLALLASIGLHPHRLARRSPRRPNLARLLRFPPVRAALLPTLRSGFRRAGFPTSTPDEALVQSARVFSALSFQDVRDAALAVRAPTLISWAEDDKIVETSIGLSLATALPDGPRLVFDQGGHNIQKTRAVELADALVDWSAAI